MIDIPGMPLETLAGITDDISKSLEKRHGVELKDLVAEVLDELFQNYISVTNVQIEYENIACHIDNYVMPSVTLHMECKMDFNTLHPPPVQEPPKHFNCKSTSIPIPKVEDDDCPF